MVFGSRELIAIASLSCKTTMLSSLPYGHIYYQHTYFSRQITMVKKDTIKVNESGMNG